MKTLFLAQITIRVYRYMENDSTEHETRLVWAADQTEADEIIKAEYNTGSEYSTSRRVWDVTLTPAMGSPT